MGNYDNRRSTKTVTIANGATVSSSVILGQASVVGIRMPASFTSGDVSFQNCHNIADNSNEPATGEFFDVYKQDGTTLAGKITSAAQGKEYVIEGLAELSSLNRFRLKVAAQGAARTVTIILRELS